MGIDDLMARPLHKPKALLADKGYDGDRFRENLLIPAPARLANSDFGVGPDRQQLFATFDPILEPLQFAPS